MIPDAQGDDAWNMLLLSSVSELPTVPPTVWILKFSMFLKKTSSENQKQQKIYTQSRVDGASVTDIL